MRLSWLHSQGFHKWAAISWATIGLAITLRYPNSILWVAFMSLWANVVAHWSSYQAARAEEKQ